MIMINMEKVNEIMKEYNEIIDRLNYYKKQKRLTIDDREYQQWAKEDLREIKKKYYYVTGLQISAKT